MVQKTVVRARLRNGKDDDIRDVLEHLIMQGHDEADIVRTALRQFFFISETNLLSRETKAIHRIPAYDETMKNTISMNDATNHIELLNPSENINDFNSHDDEDDLDRLLGL